MTPGMGGGGLVLGVEIHIQSVLIPMHFMSVLETCRCCEQWAGGAWGQDSGDMMLAVTPPDTQQESEVVGNTIGRGPTQQTPSHSAKQTRKT